MTRAGLQHIKGLAKLQHVVLWNCLRVTEAGLAALVTLTSLTHLSLRGCQQLSDSALPHVAALSALQYLNLTACERISGESSVLFLSNASLHSASMSVSIPSVSDSNADLWSLYAFKNSM